jgi:hypothetical protein
MDLIEIAKKIILKNRIKNEEATFFIIEMVKKYKEKEPDSKEISAILALLNAGYFNLNYPASRYLIDNNIQINTISDLNTMNIIKIYFT